MAQEHFLEQAGSEPADRHPHGEPEGRYLYLLALGALGIVYGDIGTSPLYAIRESFLEEHGVPPTPDNVLGVLSLIVWSLVLVISIKYLIFILRADNRGEGGILALTSLVTPVGALRPGGRWMLILLGLFGTALLYGDGMITPAISVLAAVEGLKVATPFFEPYVIPITIGILIALFLFQKRGTAGVGKVFGPVTLVWFVVLAALGIGQIVREPSVFRALLPTHGVEFFLDNGWNGFLVLGSVFLVVTGGEAIYADMGHFGRTPIRLSWFTIVLPALLLNYFGQGALIIRDPAAVENPFYRMGPEWAIYPQVIIATAATIIASQAVISGAFSLAMQSVQLGYTPRLDIEHTSATEIGQIYVPSINWALMASTIALVLGFRSSSNLAAAYGVAVTTTMVVTTLLFYVVARERWKWHPVLALVVAGVFLGIDVAFWGANLLKIPAGGWFPLVVAAAVFVLMTTWKSGRRILAQRIRAAALPIDDLVASMAGSTAVRVHGTAIYMYGDPAGTPPALLHNLKHNRVLHERVICLSVATEEVPYVDASERSTVIDRGDGFYSVVLHYGFMEDVDVPKALARVRHDELEFREMETSYFLGRETLIASRRRKGMAIWREKLFALMARNARSASSFFRLPPNRVVELGAQVEL